MSQTPDDVDELNEPRVDGGADLVWPNKPHCGAD